MTAIYRKRENIFVNGESEWRARDDALVRRAPDGSENGIAWRDVMALRLRSYPTMAKPRLHQFVVSTAASEMTIDNSHFLGAGQFEDRSATYTPFVRAALERVAALSPNCRVAIGAPALSFWASLSFAAIGLIMLAV